MLVILSKGCNNLWEIVKKCLAIVMVNQRMYLIMNLFFYLSSITVQLADRIWVALVCASFKDSLISFAQGS